MLYAAKLKSPLLNPCTLMMHFGTASLIALLIHSHKADRAVNNGLRNLVRTADALVGLTGECP